MAASILFLIVCNKTINYKLLLENGNQKGSLPWEQKFLSCTGNNYMRQTSHANQGKRLRRENSARRVKVY